MRDRNRRKRRERRIRDRNRRKKRERRDER